MASGWTTSETFEDGPALYAAVCNLGLEGVVAKKLTSACQPARARQDQAQAPELLAPRLGDRSDAAFEGALRCKNPA
jgi:hypothetical protein